MSCENVQELISSLLDGQVAAGERESVLAHIGACRQCGAHLESMQNQRIMLRSTAEPVIPAALADRLRVMASHERERQLARVSIGARMRRLAWRVELAFDNLMRPVALPFTGGLLSTLLVFSLLVPSLSFSHDLTGGPEFYTAPVGKIVTNVYGQIGDPDADFPRIELSTASGADYVNVVDMTVDENGNVVDWTVVHGDLTEDMKSIILFSKFQPATLMGMNTSAKIRVVQFAFTSTVRG